MTNLSSIVENFSEASAWVVRTGTKSQQGGLRQHARFCIGSVSDNQYPKSSRTNAQQVKQMDLVEF